MSGTELSRLMTEVTAQPPVDVDFAAVAGQVRRRRVQRQGAAAFAAAVIAAVAIVVPVALSGGGTSANKGPAVPGTPSSAPVAETSWQHNQAGSLSWRTPPGWQVSSLQPVTHSTPAGAEVGLAILTTFKVTRSCSNPDLGIGCVLHIPANGVEAEISQRDNLTQTPATDLGTVAAPDETCRRLGGAATFTSLRNFGTAPFASAVRIWACLGKDVQGTAPAQLRTLVASETDAEALTVDASWRRITVGHLTLQLPPGWGTDDARGTAANVFDSSCIRDQASPQDDVNCTPDLGRVNYQGTTAWISGLDAPSNPRSKPRFIGTGVADGACKAAHGSYWDVIQRHLGPQEGGQLLTVTACVGGAAPNNRYETVQLILNSVADTQYPDPRQVCSAVPGSVTSAALETVGDIRTLKWGSTQPAIDVFREASAGDFAAWCWVRDDAQQVFHVWAAHVGDPAVKVVDVGLPTFSWTAAPSVAPQSLVASSSVTLGASPTPEIAPPTAPAPARTNVRATGTTAAALCGSAFGTYASAELTTVGEIRQATWGPMLANGKGRLADAFPGAKASDPAAWCWSGNNLLYTAYVVHAGDLPVDAAGVGGWIGSTPPSGPPQIP